MNTDSLESRYKVLARNIARPPYRKTCFSASSLAWVSHVSLMNNEATRSTPTIKRKIRIVVRHPLKKPLLLPFTFWSSFAQSGHTFMVVTPTPPLYTRFDELKNHRFIADLEFLSSRAAPIHVIKLIPDREWPLASFFFSMATISLAGSLFPQSLHVRIA